MASAALHFPHRNVLKQVIRLVIAGVLATGLTGCHDDDDDEDFAPYDAPNSVAIADMNNDGLSDVTIAYTHVESNAPDRGYASVILQTSAGVFARGVDSAVGYNPSTLASGNIDNAGSPDVAVANAGSGTVSVLLQSANTGQLSALTTLNVGGVPFDVAVGNVDSDAFADVVVANAARSSIAVVHSDAGVPGSFLPSVALEVGNLSTAVAIGDVDGDGLNDIVVANQDLGGNYGRVSIFFTVSNTLPVQYATRVDLPIGTEPMAVKIADVDADGLSDLIVANEGGGSLLLGTSGVTVIRHSGPQTFLAPVTYTTARGTVSIAVADVNNDTRPDLVTANRGGSPRGTVSVLFQHPTTDGMFLTAVNYAATYEPLGVAIGNLNADPYPDIAVADGNRATMMVNSSTTPGTFAAPVRIGE